MKFDQFQYTRPAINEFSKKFKMQLAQFEQAKDFASANVAFQRINELRTEFTSMSSICHIRHTIDTTDKFYEAEHSFFDQNSPSFEALNNEFYELLIQSKFRTELEKQWGNQLFTIADLSLKTFEPIILKDLQEENRLTTEYMKLKATAKIEVDGKDYNLSSIHALEVNQDRALRKKAWQAKWDFYAAQGDNFDEIFDQLIKVRHSIAKKLGYKNFVELGYARMLRSDYNAEMVANFRQQVKDHIVPIASRLYERQRKRLELEKLTNYDEEFKFASGNPAPQGEPQWIVEQAQTMYSELSADTKEFFDTMIEQNLMDLVNRDGKATGGYCTFIGKFKTPYIFSNFNGTSGDIDVLTHEAGHAFQVYKSRNIGLNEYNWPTFEACEIHSMSMEFFTWPWMNLFFKGDTDKYKFMHLGNAIYFLPYGVAVDEFQHVIYENPDLTPAERHAAWKKIEQKYLPHRNYDGNEYLEKGAFWHKQNHIFASPFYYIDYTLAQICAFQFWKKDRDDHATAWKDYVQLCEAGGSQSFLELVKLANLQSPFADGCIESVVSEIDAWLESVDDAQF
ncbi:MAG: M3 family oligoendopeptidase [Saprospiraceae bacterium]